MKPNLENLEVRQTPANLTFVESPLGKTSVIHKVDQIKIKWDRDAINFDANDVTLKKDGYSVPRSNIVVTGSGSEYTINILNDAASKFGKYTLSISEAGVKDAAFQAIGNSQYNLNWRQVADLGTHRMPGSWFPSLTVTASPRYRPPVWQY